jgi:hypothetical protein
MKPETTSAPEQLYGQTLLERLQFGWAPLPNKTIFALVVGGLKIRMTRSLVTMISIILAIAFLTYTGLSNRLYFSIAQASEKLKQYTPMDPKLVTDAADAVMKMDVFSGLPVEAKKEMALDMAMGKTDKQQTELMGLTGPLGGARADDENAKTELAKLEADQKSAPQDLANAKAAVESARTALETLRARKAVLEDQIQLGKWLASKSAAQDREIEAKLTDAVKLRVESLLEMASSPGRLNEDGLEQLNLIIETAAARPEAAAHVEILKAAMAEEKTNRAATKLGTMLLGAGVNAQATLKGNPLDTWLIIMALLTCTVGIANAMLMSVTERFREIGTMKCLGALDSLVVKLFLLESGLLGAVGAVIGIALGLIVAGLAALVQFHQYGMQYFPFLGGLVVLVESIVAGLLLAVAGAVYPALVAAGMKPVDALRVDE